MVGRNEVLEHCLSQPGAYLDNPWGEQESVVKVGGKIFCFLGEERGPVAISVKNTREAVQDWRQRYPDHVGVAPYLHKQLWNRVSLSARGAPSLDEARELIDDSYALVVAGLPRSKRP